MSYKLGGVQQARSVRSFAAQLNLTNNPGRSSLVKIYIYFSLSQEPRNRTDLRQTQNKRFMRIKTQLATTASAAAAMPVGKSVF